ncbi:Phage shock protein A [Pseudoalteromonas holothuriae]|uniref:Phage shock protein A n=1 Tax=Pseudoalteromonas holothuriae TaxID=2963714 RepID=A0A9W4QWB3_9GAMM|nr:MULTISPECIES: PspA/IM30 family protein [unclassified Pseudoalteromonas]CAH9052981.1 Phage shock protein A [Pseudoalteromonas sp. CIP111951]CAH9056548.1 Phage shock protein A [Pseudoalteromonas sp. CIP111854]
MALINRIEDLIKSEVNAFLDKAEDPQKLAAQLVIELSDALSECRSTAAAIICEQKALERRQANQAKQIEVWQQKAEHALHKDREDLAKAALCEKQKLADAQQSLMDQKQTLDETLTKLRVDADKLASKIQTLKAKQQQLLRADRTANARIKVRSTLNKQDVENVLSRFDELEHKVERIEAQVESYELGQSATAQQFEAFERDEKINSALASLKQKMQSTSAPVGA